MVLLPMIISRTPFRVSLFGGGTDYPEWFRENGGAVFGTTIDKYCYISVRLLPPFFPHKHRLVYSKVETVAKIEKIKHPAVRGMLEYLGVKDGLEIHHDGDLPARSGLGSSSSFTVGLMNSLRALDGQMSSARFLAEQAIHVEQNVLKENVGVQDQIWAAFGGTNRVQFFSDGSFAVTPLVMSRQRRTDLQSCLMLFFTGFSRIASDIAAKTISNIHKRRQQLLTMRSMVDEAVAILQNEHGDIRDIGVMLDDSWRLKQELADNICPAHIKQIYTAGRAAGALGGKLLGAGGGGFMLFFVPLEKQKAVREALAKLILVKFGIGSPGSTIVVYEPDL
jgi:D-glycero-alpha-D-manno-heptose-7-phosphate kinase